MANLTRGWHTLPYSFSISKTPRSKMLVLYSPLSSSNSAINLDPFTILSSPSTLLTRMAPGNRVSALSQNASKTCSRLQETFLFI